MKYYKNLKILVANNILCFHKPSLITSCGNSKVKRTTERKFKNFPYFSHISYIFSIFSLPWNLFAYNGSETLPLKHSYPDFPHKTIFSFSKALYCSIENHSSFSLLQYSSFCSRSGFLSLIVCYFFSKVCDKILKKKVK